MAVEAGPDALRLRFLPHQYSDLHEIQGGEQKTYECFLAFGSDTVTQHPLEWCRNRAVVCADPEWTIATGAVPFLAPLDGEHAALVQVAIEGPDRFERKREIVDEYGWRHFGDIYGDHEALRHEGPMPLTSHYNNQYDPVAGFASQFLRTGNPAWWRQCAQLAAHVVDVDVYHTTRDKAAYNHGLFWHTYHYGDADTATHRTYPRSALGKTHGGGPSADHNYTSGLLLHYFLTGDEASRQTVMDLAQYVIDLDDGRKTIFRWLTTAPTGGATSSADGGRYHGPGRGPANSLNALVDGYRLTGRADFLAKAEELIRRVVHPADDIEGMELREPERRWFYTMFLQSLGKYLWYKHELGQHDRMYRYARASLLHYARWMAEHEYPYLEKPDKLEFPTETWAAQDIRKSDVLFFAAMHVSTSDRGRLLERAEFFHRRSVEQLQSMPTRIFARPIIVLLTSGFMRSWRERGFANLSASGEPADDFGQPSRFVAQRIVAMKRAKAIAAAVLVVALVAVAATLWALAF